MLWFAVLLGVGVLAAVAILVSLGPVHPHCGWPDGTSDDDSFWSWDNDSGGSFSFFHADSSPDWADSDVAD